MNPFDLKALVMAPHGQHPVAVHFPIALFVVSYGFDLLGAWRRNALMSAAARYNLMAAALAAPVAVATGLIAWQWKHEGVALKGNLRLHVIGAVMSLVLIWVLCWMRRREPRAAYFGLGLVGLLVVALTAHIGGMVAG